MPGPRRSIGIEGHRGGCVYDFLVIYCTIRDRFFLGGERY
jgi:hypothetical protein